MTPFRTTRVAGTALALSLLIGITACSPSPGEPMDTSTGAASAAENQRDAQAIREDFYASITDVTTAIGGQWEYLDGVPYSPQDRESFAPKACASGPQDARQLLLMVTTGPSTDGPAAIERMQKLLEDRGMEITGYIPGKTKRAASAIDAQSPNGAFVSYRTNDLRTNIRFGSECSSHPSMLTDVD
ncbi:hypothetical protein [Arthrobacter sp.]|uniref:hypothetical protein n=1 Tax=Arthrobacter sp. TaxID=1667 RepID=UPI003A9325D2